MSSPSRSPLGQVVLDVPVHAGSGTKPAVEKRLASWKPATQVSRVMLKVSEKE